MKNLIVLLIICTGILSCKKESNEVLTPIAEQRQLDPQKKIKVFLNTHNQGLTLTFHPGYRNAAAADELSNALWYLHNRLSTGDTSKSYLYPYTSMQANSGLLYAYPDSALQADPDFPDFQAWFEKIVTNWMSKHECSGCVDINISKQAPDYFTKIRCTVQAP